MNGIFHRNPNETPPTFLHISQTKHNHIATSIDLNKLTKLVENEVSFKQKRQMARITTRRRNKRNRNYYNNNDDSDESDEHETNYDDRDSDGDDERNEHRRDRLDETPDQHCPFWDAYDPLNQYYLEIGMLKYEIGLEFQSIHFILCIVCL